MISLHSFGKVTITLPTETTNAANVLIKIAMFLYNIWNLIFIDYLLPKYCIAKSDTAMSVIASEYIPAFYVLFLCVVFFNVIPWVCKCFSSSNLSLQNCAMKMERVCIRVRHHWSVKNSIIHSLTTFVVLSYARIASVTLKLLTPVVLYGEGGMDSSYRKIVVWYDGTMSYFGSDHLPYALGAIFMLITFVIVPPLLLLSYPLLPVLMARLGLEDYWIVKKLIINPLSKCVHIFDAFQCCYKDEYRLFAGLLFVYRTLGLAAFAATIATNSEYVWIQLVLLLALLVHCTCQPYKKKWHNVVEGFIFTIVTSIAAIS